MLSGGYFTQFFLYLFKFLLKTHGRLLSRLCGKFSAKMKWRKINYRHSLPSHLSFSNFREIQEIRFVNKSWNKFLSEDRILMLKIVRKAEPYLEDLCGKLSYDVSDLYRPVSKKQKKISYMDDDYFRCQKFRDFDHDCAFGKCKFESDDDYYSSQSDESCGPDSDGYYSLGHEAGRCPVKMDFSKEVLKEYLTMRECSLSSIYKLKPLS